MALLPANAKVNTCDDEVEAYERSDRDPGHVVEFQRALQTTVAVGTMMELKEATTALTSGKKYSHRGGHASGSSSEDCGRSLRFQAKPDRIMVAAAVQWAELIMKED